ncbi:MAG: hypothetical protein FJX11_01670 [Alphaproteobacteria bacterium]|nr:hypothetical protein [Alphaproteobacteria bacterium]
MRVIGVFVLLVALAWLGYALFALAWDSGTSRATDDKIQAALASVLAIGAVAMIARQAWGWMVCAGVGVVFVAVVVMATIASTANRSAGPVANPFLLRNLPTTEQALAARLDWSWWATSVDSLRQRERDDDALARPWEIQGDGGIRLLVLRDPTAPFKDEYFPFEIFLILNADKGTVAIRAFDRFHSENRTNPIELRLADEGGRQRVVVVARSDKECQTKTFIVERAAGTVTPLSIADAC